MRIYNEIPALTDTLFANKIQNKRIGLVPTMGALHQGHLKLIDEAKRKSDLVVCSIYVNPTQFNNTEDLKKYPRTMEADLAMLEERGCDVVFCPDDTVMYSGESVMKLDFGHLETVMEGKFRPGHFNGVGLVVSKLLNIVKPDYAFFGQKDLQQFAVIQELVSSLMFDVELICVPIVREESGLAMSSRNRRLTNEGAEAAAIFYESLNFAKQELLAGSSIEETIEKINDKFKARGIELEYFNVVDKNTLKDIDKEHDEIEVALCIAGYVEGVRLIDNMLLN